MSAVREAIIGQHKAVADRFTTFVMCGLCAMVCGAGIRPHRIGAYTRRLVGAFHGKDANHLLERISEIASGRYQDEWDALLPVGQSNASGKILQDEKILQDKEILQERKV